jgi:rod shape-determining protein MreB
MTFFTQELAIDLGTANTVIFQDGAIVLDEPSVVAVDAHKGDLVAVGEEAQLMEGKEHQGIITIRPLSSGVIADFDACEKMIKGFIEKMTGKKRSFLSPKLKVVVGISKGSTPVEIRAVRDSFEHAGAHDLFLIHEPMASALGVGLDVMAPVGNMIVDIGGGTTEVAAISLGGIVHAASIRIAGNQITHDIVDYMARQYNLRIGFKTAEHIKHQIGSVLMDLPADEAPEPMLVQGRNVSTSHPIEATITYKDIACCIDKTIAQIENGIMKVLETVPPEIYTDIIRNGIWLAGGGALLRGISKRFSDRMNLKFHIAEDPLKAVARGTCISIEDTDKYKFLMR